MGAEKADLFAPDPALFEETEQRRDEPGSPGRPREVVENYARPLCVPVPAA